MRSFVRLRHVADVNPQTPEFERAPLDAGVTFLPLEAVWADERLDVERTRPRSEVSSGYMRFRSGDILCPKVTPTFQAARSALVVTNQLGVGAATTEVHVVRAKPDVDARYIRYGLLSKPFLEEGASRFQGVAGLQRVPDDFVRDFRLLSVPLVEQRRIADFLDDKLAVLEAVAKAIVQMSDQSAEHAQVSMDILYDGTGSRPPLKGLLQEFPAYGVLVPTFIAEGVPFIRIKDLTAAGTLDRSALPQITVAQSQEYRRTVLRTGDVLLGVVGSTDKMAVVPSALSGANIARAVARLRPRAGVPPAVLVGWAQTSHYGRAVLAVTESDTAQPTLNMSDLRNFRIPLPNRPLPDLAAAVLLIQARCTALQQETSRQRQLIEERKRALITACVTGEFDVSTASARAGDAALAGVRV